MCRREGRRASIRWWRCGTSEDKRSEAEKQASGPPRSSVLKIGALSMRGRAAHERLPTKGILRMTYSRGVSLDNEFCAPLAHSSRCVV